MTEPGRPGHRTHVRLHAVAILAAATAVAACEYPVPIGLMYDAAPVDARDLAADAAPGVALCDPAGTSTTTGSGPDGSLVGFEAYVLVRGGFCGPSLELVLVPGGALTFPYDPRAAVITAALPVDLLAASADWSGTLTATITTAAGAQPATGTLEVVRATPAGGVPATRLWASASFDAAGWQLTTTIDAPYCLADSCP